MYTEQIKRIKQKLELAKKTDSDFEVFGASSHKYKLKKTATDNEIVEFENKYDISLPHCYRSFITLVGNGGFSYMDSAAGPYYGIFPLGKGITDFVARPELYLNKPVIIFPGMKDEYWEKQIAPIEVNDDISDEEYDNLICELYGGIMPIGSQGCTYYHALVLNGEHKGKVVNIDIDLQKPKFCFEDNFLNWYERWLDEVISKILICNGASWFGYTMGGDDIHLLSVYNNTHDLFLKENALLGFFKLKSIKNNSKQKLHELYIESKHDLKIYILELLAKFDYTNSKTHIEQALPGNPIEMLTALKSIYYYAKDDIGYWVTDVDNCIQNTENENIFRFATYIFNESGLDVGKYIAPFVTNKNKSIRSTALYSLSNLPNKNNYLKDDESTVVHTSLQALSGIVNSSLLPYYKNILERFQEEEDYVLVNLMHRLREFGKDAKEILEIASNHSDNSTAETAKEILSGM